MNLSDNLCKLSISERLFILIIGLQNDIKIKCKSGNYYSIIVGGHKGLINCIVKHCNTQYPIIITPITTVCIHILFWLFMSCSKCNGIEGLFISKLQFMFVVSNLMEGENI